MRTIVAKLADQILFSTYRQFFPGCYVATPRAMSTRFWDGKNFTKVEDFSKVDQFDRDKSRDEVESEKILEKLGEDDYRVSPRPTLQAAPRGLKYRKKYIQELESHVKQEEKFSIENIEKILGEMVAAQQQQRKEKTPKGLDEIKDEFSLLKNERPPHPYGSKQKKCIICEYDVHLDYKNVRLLSQFVSNHTGMIYHRGITGLCIPMQKHIASLVKTSRAFGFMPYSNKIMEFQADPDIRQKDRS